MNRINNIHISGDGHPDKWYLTVWGELSTRKSMEELKQKILLNDEIVDRLKSEIEQIKTDNEYHASQGCATSIMQSRPFLELLETVLGEKNV